MLKFVLLILDGFGLREAVTGNAIKLARTPTLDRLLNGYPMIPLHTSGADVGLPAGVMGNSEVGHMNIGAGRIVMQDLVRVNHSIAQGEFQSNPVLLEQMQAAKARGGDYHVLGLCSDGGVHSHMDHFNAVLKIAKDQDLEQVYFHAMMDGRDTSPWAGADYLQQVQAWMNELGIGTIASVIGGYYAMDRDNRWERIELAYDMLVHGRGTEHGSAAEAMSASYAGETGDEFVTPRIIGPGRTFKNGDALLSVNYRADRIRQLVRALKLPGSTALDVDPPDIDLCCMTNYSEEFNFPVLFPPVEIFKTMPEILSHAGYRQLRLAETEKYAHVTYFLNGGKEKQYPGEDRSLVQSPKVATYDLK
ncbi:MAG: 2,3-bisphosphoglycerate-independent phosphoglycerate mutase, partial [Candidatus Marinimicrobia bacterium]|nr:2,3-bisphosphoglycerate-independent phosphoglycerate mutase [Candidatus Neomarinimicrobiota bacterium]